jgi:regulation of enolase protein 1 (concanavalin A-like superfamily)
MAHQLTVPGLPFALTPTPADRWRLDGEAIAASALARTDVFVDPGDGTTTLNAATLLGAPPAGDFQLSAQVSVDFAATFDAGVLLLWIDERHWAKLCFEFSPAREPMVVSVVCRDVADDANAVVLSGQSVWLRVSRIGRAFAYHASTDGQAWRMVRHFALDSDGETRIGFEAQSPVGEGCAVRFESIRYVTSRLADLRDGS